MWATIVGIGAKLFGGLMSFIGSLVQYVGYYFAYRTGVRKERQRQAERTAEIKDEQLEIAARRPDNRSDLLDRMRKRGL